MESKQTTRTTPDEFAPTIPNTNESPTQHRTQLFEPTTKDVECKKITSMDQQQRNRHDEHGSRNVDTKIDEESGNKMQKTEEKSKEEVVILSTEKSNNFSKAATISIVSDVHAVAGDTVNR